VRAGKRLAHPFERRRGVPWPELVTSGAATVALFVVALMSMTSVSSTIGSRVADFDASRTRTEVTFLTPAREPDRPRPKPTEPRRAIREPNPRTPTTPEPTIAPAPAAPTTTPADTAGAKTAPPVRLTDIVVPSDRVEFNTSKARTGLGAAAAPAGLTDKSRIAGARAAMSAHDSAFAAWAEAAHEIQRWSTMSREATAEVAESQQKVKQLAQRVGTAGNSGDVHVMSGQGKDGVGAAGGGGLGGSIGVPLFSRGPSRAQRVRDSVIDADVRAGLAILAARIAAKRDSIRADSIRADSARKIAQSRKP
jgi:hypothetical protein